MKRVEVQKTYKLYIGGKYPRTESGRYYKLMNKHGDTVANMCLGSRKDVGNAVVACRKAFGPWSGKTAFNRSQILYRIAEMMEGRSEQFIDELVLQGFQKSRAREEVRESIERVVYYAGWCDKYIQVLGSVNPVSSSHFNFSVHEPMGVVGIVSSENSPLLGLVSLIMPAIAGGNTCVVLTSEKFPLSSITLAEVINSSDVPGGVVNIITGKKEETLPALSSHMDVNAISSSKLSTDQKTQLEKNAVSNLKRTFFYADDWEASVGQGLYYIADLQEVKTTWHPIENIGGATSSY